MVTFRNNNNNRRNNLEETIEVINQMVTDLNMDQTFQIMKISKEKFQVEITIMHQN